MNPTASLAAAAVTTLNSVTSPSPEKSSATATRSEPHMQSGRIMANTETTSEIQNTLATVAEKRVTEKKLKQLFQTSKTVQTLCQALDMQFGEREKNIFGRRKADTLAVPVFRSDRVTLALTRHGFVLVAKTQFESEITFYKPNSQEHLVHLPEMKLIEKLLENILTKLHKEHRFVHIYLKGAGSAGIQLPRRKSDSVDQNSATNEVLHAVRQRRVTLEKLDALFKSSPHVQALCNAMDIQMGPLPKRWYGFGRCADQYGIPIFSSKRVSLVLTRDGFKCVPEDVGYGRGWKFHEPSLFELQRLPSIEDLELLVAQAFKKLADQGSFSRIFNSAYGHMFTEPNFVIGPQPPDIQDNPSAA